MKESMLCVQVDCRCPFSPNWLYYPKGIVGIHRVHADDPRAKVGERWARGQEYCHGSWYSQGCESEDCNPAGEVVEILLECDKCSFKNDAIRCPLSLKEAAEK